VRREEINGARKPLKKSSQEVKPPKIVFFGQKRRNMRELMVKGPLPELELEWLAYELSNWLDVPLANIAIAFQNRKVFYS